MERERQWDVERWGQSEGSVVGGGMVMLLAEGVRMKVWRGKEEGVAGEEVGVGGMPEIAYVIDECRLGC